MASRERPLDRANRRARQQLTELGRELRQTRLAAGLNQTDVARGARLSRAHVSRIERGEHLRVSYVHLSRVCAAVGLDLAARTFPDADPLRDARHDALLARFLDYAKPPLTSRREVPFPNVNDRRAWDAVISGDGEQTAVEAETVVRDAQAIQRKLNLKMRDGGVDRLILVVADTRANREALRQAAGSIGSSFPVSTRAILDALAAGKHPIASGIVLL